MLANRLNVLLAERQLSIKQVVDETGISRNTISNISNNVGANVATETIDALCRYLNVKPADFFSYTPYSFRLQLEKEDDYDSFILLDVKKGRTERMYSLDVYYDTDTMIAEDRSTLDIFDLYIVVDDSISDNNDTIRNIFENLPVVFQTELSNMMLKKISERLNKYNDPLTTGKIPNNVRIPILDYLRRFEGKQLTTLVRLPWGDYKRSLDVNKREATFH
ncbi:helix-turn-helix domain-containing protein [Levilactobacillus andaensis]|uniref:helix-turn-helix domain-containing protein n=1 Tax=Levilactobacillus andaensis TaxID=2799570 RepID=UPI001940F169|nr:helix-turn-helix transcriptional regulator [Levilactobacillus andaensis]